MIKSRTSKLKDIPQSQQLAQQQKGKEKSLAIVKDGLMLTALRFFFFFLWVCCFPLKLGVLQKDPGFVEKNYG